MRFAVRVALVTTVGCLGPLSIVASCTYTWDLPDQAGTDGATNGGHDSAAQPSDASTTDEGPTTDAGTPCTSSKNCLNGSLCIFSDHRCGTNGGTTGTCVATSDLFSSCPASSGAVNGTVLYCGCDGKLYGAPCMAYKLGYDLAAQGCSPPEGGALFKCGNGVEYCPVMGDYCTTSTDDSHCVSWADSGCGGNHTCACVQGSCAKCSTDVTGGTTVECF